MERDGGRLVEHEARVDRFVRLGVERGTTKTSQCTWIATAIITIFVGRLPFTSRLALPGRFN